MHRQADCGVHDRKNACPNTHIPAQIEAGRIEPASRTFHGPNHRNIRLERTDQPRALAGLVRRSLLRQLTPLCTSSQGPQNAVKHRACHATDDHGCRRSGRSTGCTTAHCSSFSSQRRAIDAFGVHQSASRMTRIYNSAIVDAGPGRVGSSTRRNGSRTDRKRTSGFSLLNRSKVDPNRRLSIEDGAWVLRLRQMRSSVQVAAH